MQSRKRSLLGELEFEKHFRFVSKFRENWTTHGFNAFAKQKYFLFFCAICCVTLGVWECQNTLTAYLSYSVETTVKRIEVGKEGIPFPAITFCSNSGYSRNSVGGNQPLIISGYTASGMSINEALKWSQSCYSSRIESLDNDKLFSLGFTRTMKWAQIDSDKSVLGCYYNQKEFNCSRQFLNKLTDAGFCFTINSEPEITDAYSLETKSVGAYGTSGSERLNFVSHLSGPKTGLQIDFISNTSDYCAMFLGAQTGFLAVVHNPESEPFIFTKSLLILSPGYYHNVGLRVHKKQRNTEAMGYCKSHLYLFTFNKTVAYKSSDKYIIDCITQILIKKCHCFPYYAPPKTNLILTDPTIQPCTGESAICQQIQEKIELSIKGYCYKSLPLPCSESKILVQLTSSIYPSANQFSTLKRKYKYAENMTLHEFRLDFFSVNFFMVSSHYQVAFESLAMTWVDLMNSLGGAIGMAVGMSILSVFELFLYFVMKPVSTLYKYKYKLRPEIQKLEHCRPRYCSDSDWP